MFFSTENTVAFFPDHKCFEVFFNDGGKNLVNVRDRPRSRGYEGQKETLFTLHRKRLFVKTCSILRKNVSSMLSAKQICKACLILPLQVCWQTLGRLFAHKHSSDRSLQSKIPSHTFFEDTTNESSRQRKQRSLI